MAGRVGNTLAMPDREMQFLSVAGSRCDVEVARRLGWPITTVQRRGAGEYCAIRLAQPRGFPQMLGPGVHCPDLRPALGTSNVLIQPPDYRTAPQPHLPNLGHDGEEGSAVGRVYMVAHELQHPAGVVVQQFRQLERRGLRPR